jgi:glycosyltransferase involved in cell wall biosynthesis
MNNFESSPVLRVTFVVHSSLLWGAERTLLDLVRDLIGDHGVACQVVVPRLGPLVGELQRIGAMCVVGQYGWWIDRVPQVGTAPFVWANNQAFQRTVMPAIRDFDPDIIWTQTMVVPWGAVAAAQLNKPHVWYVTEYGERDHGYKFFFLAIDVIAKEILESSDLVYTVSKSVSETVFPNVEHDHLRVLYCYVPPPLPDVGTPSATTLFNIPAATKLGIFSQTTPSKGQEDVVLAVAVLCSRGYDVELLIAGGGHPDYVDRLVQMTRERGIANRVRFAGILDDVYGALREIDIAVVCSRLEAFGRVGVEPMLLGKPVIYPNTGGIIEYMVEGKTGLSYTPGDVDGLVERLECLIADPGQRQTMGRFGREHALKLFSKANFSGEVHHSLQRLRLTGRKAKGMPDSIEKLLTTALNASPQSRVIGRNHPCPCGSGKRWKHCHGRVG